MNPLSQNNFNFLKALAQNNNRNWFDENRNLYTSCRDEVASFADEVIKHMNKFDVLTTESGKKSMYRIFRDVRFSHDKTPYKTNWSGYFRRSGAERRGGYYYSIAPGNTFIGGGFWGPNKDDLLLLRQQIEGYSTPLRKVLNDHDFNAYYGDLLGEQLKTAPKGFDKESEEIDLLRYKQFYLQHHFTDEEVLSEDFPKMVAEGFQKILPFFDVMTEYLITDLNGERLI